MSFKKASNNVQKNSDNWVNNFKAKRPNEIKKAVLPLYHLYEFPKEINIIERYRGLVLEKSKKKKILIISEELNKLWIKLNQKAMELKNVGGKVLKLITDYQKFLKRRQDTNKFEKLFDISYKKRCYKKTNFQSTLEVPPGSFCDLDLMCDDTKAYDRDYSSTASKQIPKLSSNIATFLVIDTNVSSNKAAMICKKMAESGVDVPTPSQKTIYRHVIKFAEQKVETNKQHLKLENWALHFDGKKINKKEIQVVVLKNDTKEIKLGVLVLENGKAVPIFNGIREMLEKYNLFQSIKMIICDTTSVNTGKKGGVVSLLQNHWKSLSLPPPQYIGCQHHILDLLLRHIMDEVLGGKTTSPNIEYPFVSEIINNYDHLRSSYIQNKEEININKIKWRDDMKYLYELCVSFQYYLKNQKFPRITFKSIPPISNARWNSRAILALLAFILIPKYRTQLYSICEFISGTWFDIWFSDHCFKIDDYSKLNLALLPFKNAHLCFQRHWVQEESAIPKQQRSNVCAERAIKVVQDIFPLCKTTHSLNLKFITHK